MAGIAYSALIYTKMAYFQESPLVQQFLYITGLVVCMCLSLRNVFGTTLLTMLGPGKALRGPDGSMHTAVDGMLDAFEGIVIVQHLTIYSFMLTAVVYSWGAASMSVISSTTLMVLILSMTYTMYIRTRVVEGSFPLRRIPLVSGAFFPKDSPERAAEQAASNQAQAAAVAAAAAETLEATPQGLGASTHGPSAEQRAQQLRTAAWQQQQQQQEQQQQQQLQQRVRPGKQAGSPITQQHQPSPGFPSSLMRPGQRSGSHTGQQASELM